MDTQPARSTESFGSGRFRLGHGAGGTCGHVDLRLRHIPEAAESMVEWCAGEDVVPGRARRQIVRCVESFLEGYLALNPVGGLHVAVVGAGWNKERRNEPERAATIALHEAIKAAGLPPPPLYASPPELE